MPLLSCWCLNLKISLHSHFITYQQAGSFFYCFTSIFFFRLCPFANPLHTFVSPLLSHTTMGSGGLSESWSIGAACCQRCLFSGFLLFSFTNIFTRNSVDHRCRNPPKLFLSSSWLSFVTLCFFCSAKYFHVRLKKNRIARFKNFVKK